MLRTLTIRDFVIVDRLELDFLAGFTVLTGETGAGKSILLDALGLLLGDRAEAGMVRQGRDKAELTAEFDITAQPELVSWLAENDLTEDDECIVRRVVDSSGRSRGYINGRNATMQQLRSVGEMLVDIHGQHAHQSLMKPDAQRALLDAYADTGTQLAAVAAAYRRWKTLRDNRLERERNAAGNAAEREQLGWQVDELSALQFNPAEWQETQAQHNRLAHAASLTEGAAFALAQISEVEPAASDRLAAALGRLRGLVEFDPSLKEAVELLDSAEVQLTEAAHALRHYTQGNEWDPAALAALEQRIEAIHNMARKYRIPPERLADLLAEKQQRLQELGGGDGGDAALRQAEDSALNEYQKLAEVLSQQRQAAADRLGERVSAAMQTLAMTGSQFAIALLPCDEPTAGGLETIEMRVAAHAGMEPRPLAKVASGGELSRISLAIQVETSQVAQVPTLIFDEVDVGIGGRVAEIVGQLLRDLGSHHQVLCVTHLPQVAARGQQHWQVSKRETADGVVSRVEPLDPAGRIEEIARMLGGVDITATTRQHATEMLG